MKEYNVKCKDCGALYFQAFVNGLKKLIHPGMDIENPAKSIFPTDTCIPFYDFVRFESCMHCCPSSFKICPDCEASNYKKSERGIRSDKLCS